MLLQTIAHSLDSRTPSTVPPQSGDLCEGVTCALRQACTLVQNLRSTHGDRLPLLAGIEHWTIIALNGLVELSDEARYGQTPASLRYARAWTQLVRRELDQQIENAKLPGAIVLSGHLSLAIVRALDFICRARTSPGEERAPLAGAPW